MNHQPQILSSRIIHKGWLTLRQDKLKVNGMQEPYNYDIIDITDGVAIIALLDKDTLLLCKQYRHPVKDFMLELIQGGIDKGETAIEAAQRELLEETGYKGELQQIATFNLMPGSLQHNSHLFIATNLKKIQEPIHHLPEGLELIKKPIKELQEEIKQNVHKDVLLTAAVLYIQN